MKLEVLEKAARECGELIVQIRAKGLHADDKANSPQGSHFLTEADTQSQFLGIEILRAEFPNEVVIAEEQDNLKAIPDNCTVFDPVDGTTMFYNGGRDFGVTLCSLSDGRPEIGVMYFPADDMMFSCERGQGVTLNDKPLPRLYWNRPLDKTMVGTDIYPWARLDVLQGVMSEGFVVRSLDVAISGIRAVLLQETGVYYSLVGPSIWDGAAGALMVEELGGVACDPWGKPLKWNSLDLDWVMGANQELVDVILNHTKKWPGRG